MSETKSSNPYLVITMFDRPPIRIKKEDWGLSASAKWHDGSVECQANRKRVLLVREPLDESDHRAIVSGYSTSTFASEDGLSGGMYLDKDPSMDEIIAAIKSVGHRLNFPDNFIDECIADLPAVDV